MFQHICFNIIRHIFRMNKLYFHFLFYWVLDLIFEFRENHCKQEKMSKSLRKSLVTSSLKQAQMTFCELKRSSDSISQLLFACFVGKVFAKNHCSPTICICHSSQYSDIHLCAYRQIHKMSNQKFFICFQNTGSSCIIQNILKGLFFQPLIKILKENGSQIILYCADKTYPI